MTSSSIVQLAAYLALLTLCGRPLGRYMAGVYSDRAPLLERFLRPMESLVYRLAGIQRDHEMTWRQYAAALVIFSAAGFVAVYSVQRLQSRLPLNPQRLSAVSPDSSFNTAVSFVTNTNWQGYGGESTMSYFTQMVALTVQNFVSAADGMAVLAALIRGFSRQCVETIGNFWVDLLRGTLYILLTLSIVLAVILASQGVVQSFAPYMEATLLDPAVDAEGSAVTTQRIAVGPAASQVAIKQLGTNGGGFFNANSAHPLENPTPLSNFLQLLAILQIPVALWPHVR